MTRLFNRATCFTDIHFGKKSDSEQHNQDCLEFVKWFCSRSKALNADVMIFMGDWFENRTRTRHDTAHYSKLAIDVLTETGIPLIWLIGNHDMFYRDSRRIHALEYLDKYPTITVINEVTQVEDILFCPWLVGDEYVNVINAPVSYVFGHFELPTFLFNQMIEMPDRGGMHGDYFQDCKGVFSGHFHKRQCKVNTNGVPIWYIGNAFPHDFNDVHDPARGMMVLDFDHEPRFETWQDQPSFHRIGVADLLSVIESDSVEKHFSRKAIIECTNDAGLTDDDMRDLESLVLGKVRDFRVKNQQTISLVSSPTDISDETQYVDLDEMVKANIRKLDTQGRYDTDLLVTCYEEGENG